MYTVSQTLSLKFILFLLGLQLLVFDDKTWKSDYLVENQKSGRYFQFAADIFNRLSNIDNACFNEKYKLELSETEYEDRTTFDYIIVGAGVAGSTIAHELSKDKTLKILLIEAGADPLITSYAPAIFTENFRNKRTWKYKPDIVNTSSKAYEDGANIFCGKQLGGSSSTNAMIWHCGNDRDYDNWAKEGNPGWEYKNILPLIKKVERNTNPTLVNDHPYYHGTNGKVYVSSFDPKDDYTDVIKTSFTQSNYKQVDDINSGNATGVTNMQFTIENGHRCSAAWAFLRTCKYCGYDSNRNLHLIKRSLATRVIFKGKKAVGVEVVTDNVKCPDLYFKARREIVISAGAFNTPRLLMQSGIGRKVELDKFNIKQIADLPVGENYQDHVFIQSFLRVKQIESELDPTTLLAISFRYLYSRKGKLAELGLLSTQAFINTEDKNAKYPNIQYYFYRFNLKSEALVVYCETYKIKKEYVQTLLEINQYEEIILVMTTLLTPKSKGTVKLSSSNPRSAPKITTNFLSSEEDRVTLEKALGILNEVVNNDAFQSRGARIVDFKIDECEPLASSSNYTQCYMRYFSDTEYHYCGTARMGRRCKNDTVVDENLRIHGLSNIRVADASIMPRITSGNTQCPVYAIGMKAAELIKQDLNYSKENLIILGGSHHICPGDCHDKDKEIENEKRKKIIEIENEKKRMDENEKRKQQIENENRNKWQKGNSNENSFESRNQKKQSDFNEEDNYYDDDYSRNNDFQNNNFDQDNNGFDGSYEN